MMFLDASAIIAIIVRTISNAGFLESSPVDAMWMKIPLNFSFLAR